VGTDRLCISGCGPFLTGTGRYVTLHRLYAYLPHLGEHNDGRDNSDTNLSAPKSGGTEMI
jgi:hypothetical protein